MNNYDRLQSIALLPRSTFDALVQGEPEQWRLAVKSWARYRDQINSELTKSALDLQKTIVAAHDDEIDLVEEEGEVSITFRGANKTFSFRGVEAIVLHPANEPKPWGFLYGEVHPHNGSVYCHFLCDALDIYLLCAEVVRM